MMRKRVYLIWVCALFLPLAAVCFVSCAANKKMTVAATADLLESIATSSSRQSDLTVIREGMPAYLMLLDGLVEAWPENERLLLAAAQTNASFASISIKDVESNRRLYRKATRYALKALHRRGLSNPREMVFTDFEKGVDRFGKSDVPYLFWAASCWGNWIGLNLNSMEAMAELPRVELMMKRVLALDEGFYYGGPHLFMGIWYAIRPKMAGGDLNKSQKHFLRAIALGKGQFLMAHVYYAEYFGKRAFDKALYMSVLKRTLETPADILPELTLLNTVAHQRAGAMLKEADAFF